MSSSSPPPPPTSAFAEPPDGLFDTKDLSRALLTGVQKEWLANQVKFAERPRKEKFAAEYNVPIQALNKWIRQMAVLGPGETLLDSSGKGRKPGAKDIKKRTRRTKQEIVLARSNAHDDYDAGGVSAEEPVATPSAKRSKKSGPGTQGPTHVNAHDESTQNF